MNYTFKRNMLKNCITVVVASALMLSGCATLFSSRKQKVTLETTTRDATIKVAKEAPVKNVSKTKFDKMKIYNTVRVEKEGYKSTNYAFQIDKRSPTFAFAILDLAVPFYGWFYGIPIDLISPKTRKYKSVQKIPALVPYEKRKSTEKYMLINNTAFDAKGSDILWHDYLSLKGYSTGRQKDSRSVRKHNKSKDREDVKVDNTIFTDLLNTTLKGMNFIDTSSSVFTDINNSLFLNATIKKVTFHYVQSYLSKRMKQRTSEKYMPNDLLSVELSIDWEALNYYKEKVCDLKTTKKSDLFTVPLGCSESEFREQMLNAMKDNLAYALIDVRKELSSKNILTISGKTKVDTLHSIIIPKPVVAEGSRMNDYMKSVVTVKVDDGHGSGVVVSADGYIITAYHVVTGTKKIEIIFNDGTKADATIVRKNMEADLALIKIEKTGLTPLLLSQEADPEIGVDVWAIGTPKSVDLGQSVSKGILSGVRKANDVNYLQTDVSINGGNSGGALINKSGTVLGIVTSKLIGVGTEGIGFAISTQEIFNKLKVSYN